MTQKLLLSFLASFMIIFTACSGGGGGGSSDSSSSANTSVAYLIDAPVVGVSYFTQSRSGLTGADGSFVYTIGESNVTFSIGGVFLHDFNLSILNSDKKILITDLVGVDRNDSTDTKVVKILQLLQSLDSDNNVSNGISIDSATRVALAGSTLDFSDSNLSIADINTTLIAIGETLVTQDEAIAHFEQTLNDDFNYTVDSIAPIFISSSSVTMNENQSFVLNIDVLDSTAVTLALGGGDAADFNISASTLSFIVAPDFETKTSYALSVTATDSIGNSTTQNLSITILNLNDNAPVITSASSTSVNENQTSAITIMASDDDNNSITYSISGGNAASFDINSTSGVVTFTNAPDFETQTSYTFDVIASDGTYNDTQSVTININNILDVLPSITSFTTTIDENTTIGTLIGNINITEHGDSVISSFTLSDTTNFEVNASGAIRTKTTFDYGTTHTYNLTTYATNGAGNSTNVNMTINIEFIPLNIKTLVIIMNWDNYSEDAGNALLWHNKFFNKNENSVNQWYEETTGGKLQLVPLTESSGTADDGIIMVNMGKDHPGGGDSEEFRDVEITSAITNTEVVNNADFAILDTDSDGSLDRQELQIVFIVAGGEMSYGDDINSSIWAHAWSFDSNSTLSVDGVKVMRYTGVKETSGGYGRFGATHGIDRGVAHKATIGIIAHELGHSLLGLGDYYDDGGGSGLGWYDIMSGGSWARQDSDTYQGETPMQFSVYNRIDADLDASVTDVNSSQSVTITCSSRELIKLVTTKANEYFLIECRDTAKSNSDISLNYADSGFTDNRLFMMMYHVDTNKTGTYPDGSRKEYNTEDGVQTDLNHYAVALVEKDTTTLMTSTQSIEADYNDVYTGGDVISTSKTNLYDGTNTDYRIEVTNEDYTNRTMTISITK